MKLKIILFYSSNFKKLNKIANIKNKYIENNTNF